MTKYKIYGFFKNFSDCLVCIMEVNIKELIGKQEISRSITIDIGIMAFPKFQ